MYNKLIKNNYIKNTLEKDFSIFNINDFNLSLFKKNFFLEINKKHMDNSCYLEINQNAGGVDTHHLIKFFSEFYYKWLKKNFFNVQIIYLDISEYGYKKILFFIDNIFSFFLFNNESGIHRIIRKNPLLKSNKIQTSYINVIILPDLKNENFLINKEDIVIETFKAKGPGGQHVNNTNSAVRIKHIPTNIIVVCQSERSQLKNKNFAFQTLKYKICLKKDVIINNYIKKFKKNKYIRTYYFNDNYIIDHNYNKKYNLNKFFKFEIKFLKI